MQHPDQNVAGARRTLPSGLSAAPILTTPALKTTAPTGYAGRNMLSSKAIYDVCTLEDLGREVRGKRKPEIRSSEKDRYFFNLGEVQMSHRDS